jgi:hypothetical protein
MTNQSFQIKFDDRSQKEFKKWMQKVNALNSN